MSNNSVYQVSETTWSEYMQSHNTRPLTEYVSKEDAKTVFNDAINKYRSNHFIEKWSKQETVKDNYYNYWEGSIIYQIHEIKTIKRNIIFNKKGGAENNLKDQYIISWTEYELWCTKFVIENISDVEELLQAYGVSEYHIENLLHRVLYTRWGIESIYDSGVSFLYTDLISLLKDYDFSLE